MNRLTPTLAWVALLSLTFLTFTSRDPAAAQLAAITIIALAGAKAALVGWSFMELRAAHPAWGVAFTGLLLISVALLLWLATR